MKRSALPRAAATVVTSALSLALLTGCGSGDDDAKGADAKESATAAAKALGSAELEKLIIATGDVDGYKVSAADKSQQFASSKDEVKVVDEKCAPIAYVLTGFAPGDSAAYVNRQATEVAAKPSASSTKSLEDMTDEELDDAMKGITDALGQTLTIVSLSSYEGDGAKKTLSSVSDAIAGCAGGFTATAKGDTQKFTKVEKEKASGTGDESLAFAVTGDADGDKVVVHGEVVRHGGTVATYYSISLAAFAGEGDAAEYDIPAEITKGQAAKLS
ncbi:hypothetical protein AB5J56_18235 [Streptomyces sp. R21]|uniref:Lipoprotein n=1 Tax=Streptomyces sp. R21 TaxID=3238627 RepID=A0AB39P9N0_9ACTN